ncbi:alpha-1D adrenergic receptor, partial [Echinops telfairi]|uniref:Alpha-1D adrenergic receptor n=1 Tax=Echinops telfairi TaxID=9371 RepID=A0ABM0IEJ2_ECHTE
VGGLVVSAQGLGVGVFLAAFILTAVAGNLLVILSVACNRHLQTVTNYFIVNLAVADLLLSAAVLPFSATMEVLGFWAFGRAFCDVWAAVDVLCCTASILSLCTISVDRYVGVRHSLKYPAIMTERKAAAILALLWVVALVVSVGPLLGWKEPVPPDERFCGITEEAGYAVFSSVCSFYLPMAVIIIMYCRVYVVARSTTRSLEAGVKRERGKASEVVLRIHCRGAGGGAGADGARSAKGHNFRSSLSVRLLKFSREKKAAKTLAIVVGVFVLCWFPFFFVLPLGSLFPQLKPSEGVFKVIFWLGYFNSCVNPLIYPCLRAKVSSLSHRIRAGGAPRAGDAHALRADVEAVSLGVPHDVAEGAPYQAYDLADYSNLRETDI